MNPITCADVHYEDGTVKHLTWKDLTLAVGDQIFERVKESTASKHVNELTSGE